MPLGLPPAIIAMAVIAIALAWMSVGDRDTTRVIEEGAGAPQPGAHHDFGEAVGTAGARVIAVENAPAGQRLLLAEPRPAPRGIVGDGRLWTLPAGTAIPVNGLLDVPLVIGTTDEGELTIDLAAVDTLHIAAPASDVVPWLIAEAEQHRWALAAASTQRGVVQVARHNDEHGDLPLVIATDIEARRELGALPAAGRIVIEEAPADDADARSGRWQLARTGNDWLLSPIDLAVTPAFVSQVLLPIGGRTDAEHLEPVDPGVGVRVHAHVLGHVAIRGIGQRAGAPKVVELIAYLATHPAGATEEELKANLWDTRPAKGRFINVVSDARRLLGATASGTPLLPHQHGGRYQLHPTITTDLTIVGNANTDLDRAVDALEAIDGRPFTSAVGYQWAHRQGLVDDAIATIRHAATIAIPTLIARGEPDRAARIARRCLITAPLDPTITTLHRNARLAEGDALGARRVEDEYRTATGQRLPARPAASAASHG